MHNFNPENNRYLDKEEYYKLQKLLPEVKIDNYIDCDIFDIKEHIGNSKYSTILFSNISSYFNEITLEEYHDLLMSLEENLTDDGTMQIGYGKKKPLFNDSKPLDRTFVEDHKDKIIEIQRENKIITYYHK